MIKQYKKAKAVNDLSFGRETQYCLLQITQHYPAAGSGAFHCRFA